MPRNTSSAAGRGNRQRKRCARPTDSASLPDSLMRAWRETRSASDASASRHEEQPRMTRITRIGGKTREFLERVMPRESMDTELIHRELSESIIGAAMTVLNTLKPGLDEKLYER